MEFKTLRMQIEDFQSSSTITIRDLGNETRIRILKKILKLFGDVPDCRVQGRITYRLNEIILMLFLATLAGSESCLGAQGARPTRLRRSRTCRFSMSMSRIPRPASSPRLSNPRRTRSPTPRRSSRG